MDTSTANIQLRVSGVTFDDGALNGLKNDMGASLIEAGEEFLSFASTNIKSTLKEAVDSASTTIKTEYTKLSNNLQNIGNEAFGNTFSDLLSGETDKIGDYWLDALSDMEDAAKGTFSGVIDKLTDEILSIPTTIASKTFWEPIKNWLDSSIISPLGDYLSVLGSSLYDYLGVDTALGWLGLDGLFGSSKTKQISSGVSGALGMAGDASSLYGAYNALSATSLGSSMGAIGTGIGAGAGMEGIGASLSAWLSGSDVATAAYLATGPANTAVAVAEAMAGLEAALGGSAVSDAITTALLAEGAANDAAAMAALQSGVDSALAGGAAGATQAASGTAGTAALGTGFGAAMATFGGMLAGAELLAAAFGETGPVTGVLGNILGGTGSAMTPEDARRGVGYQTGMLADAASAAAAGDWAGTVSGDLQVNGLAMMATKRYGAGRSSASIGGISAEDIAAQVEALGPYAEALYDVQAIAWQVSDALSAYNDASGMSLAGAMQATEEFRAMALELGVTAEQYDALAASGAGYDEIAAAVTQTAGDLRIAMLDMAGAVERAAAETGMAAESADAFGSAAAELYNQLAVGTVTTGEAEARLMSLASTMGLDAGAADGLADRVENLWAATNAATGGAGALASQLAGLADVGSYTSATSKIVASSVDDMAVALSAASGAANGTVSAFGTLAAYFGTASAAASAFDLSGADMVGSANTGYFYHGGGMAGMASWPRFHAGLLPDEVPAVLQRGEVVIRREAVTSQTLPVLQSINETGSAGAGGVSLHVEVHGNVLADGDGLDELARVIGARLERIQAGRYTA